MYNPTAWIDGVGDNILPEFLKDGILGSRIPDMFFKKWPKPRTFLGKQVKFDFYLFRTFS